MIKNDVSSIARTASRPVVYAFTAALMVQTFHMVEHVAQVYQHAILGLGIKDSHGILFFLDLEWNHFIFNSLYFALLAAVFFSCGFHRRGGPATGKRLACIAFSAAFMIQGYHVVEHTVRMFQFFQIGCTPCKGILGNFFDGIYLHAALNTFVYLLPLIAFIVYGFHREAWRRYENKAFR